MKIAMVAGEASGDSLGAALIREIKHLSPDVEFFGIGGPAMIAEGFRSEADIEWLSVNGFIDPLLRLPRLIRLLLIVRNQVLKNKVDCFVGIDFNFFNLFLAGLLHRRGVRTIQYVSPTVWAWRQGRVRKIARDVDLVMTLYPFETEIYARNNVSSEFVGHPRAMEITLNEGREMQGEARQALRLDGPGPVVAILPGSRRSEVALSGRDFLDTARLLAGRVKRFVIPAANAGRLRQLKEMLADYPDLGSKVRLVEGRSREAMTAADAVLVNSGTATLEALLLKKPMVMSYRLGKLSYAIVSRLTKTERFALPNILAGRDLTPEFIQDAAKPEDLARAVAVLLNAEDTTDLLAEFDRIHKMLQLGSRPGCKAAEAVLKLCKEEPLVSS